MFDRVGKLLGALSCNNGMSRSVLLLHLCILELVLIFLAYQSETLLWEEMVLYHQNRIERNYIPDLRASLKAYDAVRTRNGTNTPENSSDTDDTLSSLRTLLFDRNTDEASTLEKHTRLVIASYNLRRTRTIEELLYSSPTATSKSKSLWSSICMLARLRVAFQSFKDIALTLPSFKQVTIILVPLPFASTAPSPRPLNPKQTVDILQLTPNPVTTKAVLGPN